MKLAVVVQRYGQAINGGAELHARYIAEHLARHAEVEVLTTCATDYVTWRNELPPGVEQVNGVPVRRFRVKHERDPLVFGRRSGRVFDAAALARRRARLARRRRADEPGAGRLHRAARRPTTTSACSSATATTTRIYGARAAAGRAILVPTAERDATIGLSIFQPMFRGVRALMYNSPEERAMIQAVAGNETCPASSSASARTCRSNPQPARFRQKYNIRGPFAVYVGRIDENKGCKELFEFFQGYLQDPHGQAVARADRQLAAADSRASADPPSRLPRRRRQVRRDGGRRAADHAVVLREPVDGGARGVGARPAGARQRQVRRAEGPVHPQQRRAVLRERSASSSKRCARSSRTAG